MQSFFICLNTLHEQSLQVQRYKEEHIKVKVERIMQPGCIVAAATAYQDAGSYSPGCHGCISKVVSSNLWSLHLIVDADESQVYKHQVCYLFLAHELCHNTWNKVCYTVFKESKQSSLAEWREERKQEDS